MTDQSTNQNSDGAGGEGAAGGAGGEQQGGGAPGAGGEGQSWLEKAGLPEDVRGHASVKKYAKSPEDLARAVIHLESHLGIPADQIVRMPKADDKEGFAALYNKLGRPEKPDGYTAKIEGDQMDEATFSAFKSQAHELGLSNVQVEGLAKWYGATGAQTMEQLQAADTAARTANETALKGEFGQAYEQNVQLAADAAVKFGGEDLANWLKETGAGNDPRVIKAWLAVAKAAAEPGTPDPSGNQGGDRKVMTPAEAEAELAKMESDPEIMKALTDPNHINKQHYHERRLMLIKLSKGNKA